MSWLNKTGRHWNIGQANPNCRLTETMVDEIKTLCSYMTDTELAQSYGVCRVHINEIRRGRRWSHI